MKAVAYTGPEQVAVVDVPDPALELPRELGGGPCRHGVIIRVIASGICGSDHHIYRGRTDAASGFILGHEMTGEVVEVGSDVQTAKVGDWCVVPFNVACGRCSACKDGATALCDGANPGGTGAAYGYPGLGPWQGGQAEYAVVPYADFNLLVLPDSDQARDKVLDLALLSDIFPTGFHGAYTAGVGPGSIVYVAGAGPVGLSAAHSALLLGAALVIVGDVNPTRLAQAERFGCATVDVTQPESLRDRIFDLTGRDSVDAGIDCVGFMAQGSDGLESPAAALNVVIGITRPGGKIGIPGAYVAESHALGAPSGIKLDFATSWGKAHQINTGGCPAMKYQRPLLNAILHERVQIAAAVNATPVPLADAPEAYTAFNQGASTKFLLDPHGELATL